MTIKYRYAVYMIITLVVSICIGIIIGKITTKPKIKTVVKKEVIYKQKEYHATNKIDKNLLAQWIYKNSFRCSMRQAREYADIIVKQRYPLLIAAIIKRESSFDSTALNKVGNTPVIGLMQIYCSKDHVEQLKKAGIIKSVRDLFDPETNIKAGVYILNDIININNGNLVKSLKMYCGGSRGYVNDILQTLGQLTLEVRQ